MHRFRAPSIAPGTFFVAQFSAGYTTNMSGFDLRQAQVVLQQGEAVLARIAQAAQPNGTPQLGEVHPVRRPFLSANQNYTPAALSPLRRQNPREEPGALARRDLCGLRLASALKSAVCDDGRGKA
jgi:hypothetical protein